MQENLRRPSLQHPYEYQLDLDETTVLWLEDAFVQQIKRLEKDAKKYKRAEKKGLTYKEVSRSEYSSNTPYQADEDLAFLYTELGRLNRLLSQCRYMRNHPEATESGL